MPVALEEVVPARALAVYAHPDDAEVSCGGTLARWAAGGAEVHLVVCTQGDKGSGDPHASPASVARERSEEVAAAAAVLGLAGHELLGLPDGELDDGVHVRSRIVAAVRRIRPDAVVCPDPTAVFFGDTYVNHRDHRMAGWAVLDAVSPAAANPHYFPAEGSPHSVSSIFLSGTLEPNVWVDVTDSVEAKISAVLCHRSQLGGPAGGEPGAGAEYEAGGGSAHEGGTPEWFRAVMLQRAAEGGRIAGVRYAEGFRRLALGVR